MRLVIQRVKSASVRVEDELVGRIGAGLVVLAGVAARDEAGDVAWCARKILQMRLFEDEDGRMNRSVRETGGALLLVSQFTLLGNTRKGNRPSFSSAAPPGEARQLFESLVEQVRASGLQVETGRFRTMMDVELVNQGPVTVIVDSRKASDSG